MENTELPFKRVVKTSLVVISAGIPITITITNTNHKLTTSMSHEGDEYPGQVISRGKPATKLKEVKGRQIFSE